MAVALVVLVGVGIWQVATGSDAPRETVTGVVPDVTTSPPPESTPPEQSSSPTPSNTDIAEVPADGVVVVVKAQGGRSWIAATEGNRQVFTGTLEDGKTMTFKNHNNVKLVLGNAGAIRLTVNGTDLGSPGGVGEVARLTFGPGDPTAAG
jgi:cytoskeletal protein RodZ